MKKWIRLMLVLALVLGLTACQSQPPFEQEDLSAKQLQKKVKAKDSFIFMVERDGCTYCKKLNAYIKKTKSEHDGIKIYVVDSTDFGFEKETEDSTTLISNTNQGKILLDIVPFFLYTPAIYVVKEGKVQEAGIGYNEQDATVAVWDNDSTVNFQQAEYEEFWDFVESNS